MFQTTSYLSLKKILRREAINCPVKKKVCSSFTFLCPFKVSYHLFPLPFILKLFYNPPEAFGSHSLTKLWIIAGASRGCRSCRIHWEGLIVQDPIDVSHWLGYSQGSWHEAETRPTEPIQLTRERQKNNWKLHQQRPWKKKESEKHNWILKALEQN